MLKNRIESPNTANCVPVSQQEFSATGIGKVDSAACDLLISSNVWCADVLHYISGFVAKKILESIDCPECAAALYNNTDKSISYVHTGAKSLLTCKKYENLLLPSYSVYMVVTCVDKLARRSLCK